MKVEIITFQDWRVMGLEKEDVVVTVSKSDSWSVGLSPFVLGPCELYDGHVAKNVENAWQFCKVYPEFTNGSIIKDEYWDWCKKGWNDSYAHRYPMGKGKVPQFSYWDGEKLDYVSARKKIYIPLYHKAVKGTDAFKKLQEVYNDHVIANKDLHLVDFDAYRHRMFNMDYDDVINCSNKKMGHAFILGAMLECPEVLDKYIQ